MPEEPITPENVDRIEELAIWGKGRVQQVAFSPDGEILAVGTTIGIWLYDAETLKLIRFIKTDTWVSDLIFSPDGHKLFAKVDFTAVAEWEVATGKLVR